MRELTCEEVQQVNGGLRWFASNVLWDVLSGAIAGGWNEGHTAGDSCDYYGNLPAGAQ